ncbi:MAG: hypothetical protein M3Q36_04500, partial [bacterium]|nr:hypothetical protein [bacterium]
MEFMNRGSQGSHPGSPLHTAPQPVVTAASKKRLRDTTFGKLTVMMLVLVGLLLALLTAYIATTGSKSEGSFVDGKRFQAVFLEGGQVYFGKIRDLNSKYITMDNIYYLQTQQSGEKDKATVSPVLSKLGCELHAPEDKMIINRDQVQFW